MPVEGPRPLRAPAAWSAASVSPALCRRGPLQASPRGVGKPGDPLPESRLCVLTRPVPGEWHFQRCQQKPQRLGGLCPWAGTSRLEGRSQAMRPGDPSWGVRPDRCLLFCVEFPGISDRLENHEKGADAAATATATAIFSAFPLSTPATPALGSLLIHSSRQRAKGTPLTHQAQRSGWDRREISDN